MRPIIQIFIAIIILIWCLIACFKLGEIKGRWDIARQAKGGINELVKGMHIPKADITDLITDFKKIR